jgi:hypothetical protein
MGPGPNRLVGTGVVRPLGPAQIFNTNAKRAGPSRSRSSPRFGDCNLKIRRWRGHAVAGCSGQWDRFWRWYADRQFHKWEKTVLWDMVEPYRPPRSFAPLIGTYVAAFYTGVVGAAVTEQLCKVG